MKGDNSDFDSNFQGFANIGVNLSIAVSGILLCEFVKDAITDIIY